MSDRQDVNSQERNTELETKHAPLRETSVEMSRWEAARETLQIMSPVASTETKTVTASGCDSNLMGSDGKAEGEDLFKLAVNTLLYEAGCPRRLTRKAIILIQDLDMAGHTEALLLKGIHAFYYGDKAYELFAAAEKKGLKHPLLDYYIYQCYRFGDKGTTKKADKYYNKYAHAGTPYGAGLHAEVRDPDPAVVKKAKQKLDMLMREEKCHLSIHEHLAIATTASNQYEYAEEFRRWNNVASNLGNEMIRYWLHLYDFDRTSVCYTSKVNAVKPLIDAEAGGCKDDRILSSLVKSLKIMGELSSSLWCAFNENNENGWEEDDEEEPHNIGDIPLGDDDSIFDCDDCGHNNLPDRFPEYRCEEPSTYDSNEVFRGRILKRKFRTRDAVALYYARVLIKRGSCEGYLRLGELYWYGMTHIPRNEKKAVTVWLEADRVNLATFETYMTGLSVAYMNGLGGLEVDGEKALECCIKALSVARTSEDKALVYKRMAEIYERGITPIVQDDVKAAEFKAKAAKMDEV